MEFTDRNNFGFEEISNYKTISKSQCDDLKFETDYLRVWLSRFEPGLVTIEVLQEGRWIIKKQYVAA